MDSYEQISFAAFQELKILQTGFYLLADTIFPYGKKAANRF